MHVSINKVKAKAEFDLESTPSAPSSEQRIEVDGSWDRVVEPELGQLLPVITYRSPVLFVLPSNV